MAAAGADLYSLMEHAGQAVFVALRQRWPEARLLWIFCGRGNNGGDGYVVARLARAAGYKVRVVALGEPACDQPAWQARQAWLAEGGQETALAALQGEPDVAVDALLGSGPRTALTGAVLEHVEFLNRLAAPVLAVDVPTGLQADSGCRLGVAVKASLTLCLIGLKPGLVTGAAVDLVGELQLAGLDGGRELAEGGAPLGWAQNYASVCRRLEPRARASHKGDCGRVLLVGGGPGMPGAIRLAGEASLRSGAGLVRVHCHVDNRLAVAAGRPELMLGSDHGPAELDWATIRVLGPGLGHSDWAEEQWQAVMAQPGPLVLDADGLNRLAREPRRRDDWILTPHPGEAARLLGWTTARVEADRYAAVRALQQTFGGVVLLKGAGTLIFDGESLSVCREGNPGMASGGMGDLLSGIIAALWAQGLSAVDAALVGACLHGEAADRAAAAAGERGLLASDLLPWIHTLCNPDMKE